MLYSLQWAVTGVGVTVTVRVTAYRFPGRLPDDVSVGALGLRGRGSVSPKTRNRNVVLILFNALRF